MITQQQEEACRYFREHAAQWGEKAAGIDEGKVNIIRQRNDFVLKALNLRAETRLALDIGCGTGDLVCRIARRGIDAVGVDYAREMIDIAEGKKAAEGLERARFACCSIFDYDLADSAYDLISANGFIEYISMDDLKRLLDRLRNALSPGGDFVVGSRNRLFNLFSANAFSLAEIEDGHYPLLMREAVAIASGGDIAALAAMEAAPFQRPDMEHERTGVTVATRFQYTPAQLMRLLSEAGLKPLQLYPAHAHGAPPAFKEKYPGVHVAIANMLQGFADDSPSLIPFASTFMVRAAREPAA